MTGESVGSAPPEDVEEGAAPWVETPVFDPAELVRGEAALPEAIEQHAPVMNVLHGERVLLRLPTGKEYIVRLAGFAAIRF